MALRTNLKEEILPIMVNRMILLFFVLCLIALYLYISGTRNEFLDSIQFIFLRIYLTVGLLLALSSLCGFFIDIYYFCKRKKFNYLLKACLYMLLAVFGSVTVAAVMFIITLSSGNGV